MQTKPKFTGTAGGERCCGAIVGKPTKPHRACYGARSRPRLAWELLGGPGGLAEPLAAPRAPALVATHSSPRRSRPRTPRTGLCSPAGALPLVLTAAALAAHDRRRLHVQVRCWPSQPLPVPLSAPGWVQLVTAPLSVQTGYCRGPGACGDRRRSSHPPLTGAVVCSLQNSPWCRRACHLCVLQYSWLVSCMPSRSVR